MIVYKENILKVEEYSKLTEAVGWGKWKDDIVKEALENTLYSISVYDNEKIIGYGRIIGDKTIFLYIHSIMVLPEYQAQKIGTEIMNKLLQKIEILREMNPNLRVYVGASKGKEEFYRKFGFISRKEADLGDAMILLKEN